MKKIIIIFILFISSMCMKFPVYANTAVVNKPLENIYKPPEHSREELYQDIFVSLLMPHIQKSVYEYYKQFLTETPLVDPWDIDILSVKRPNGYRTFYFVIEMQIMPYVGAHNSIGVDRITITVDGVGNVKVKKFEHIKSFQLPPHWQHIIKLQMQGEFLESLEKR